MRRIALDAGIVLMLARHDVSLWMGREMLPSAAIFVAADLNALPCAILRV
jgi:hypothetical protein